MIIAVGIASLVGILTAIDGILFSMNDSFNRLGSNSYSIRPLRENIRSNNDGRQSKRAEPLIFDQAMAFKDKYKFGATQVSIEAFCTGNAEISFLDKKTNPTVVIRGVDENYFDVSSYNLAAGRNFTATEVRSSASKCILGMDMAKEIYGSSRKNYNILVGTKIVSELDDAISAAYTPMRKIRKLRAADDNDFEIRKSDSILKTLKELTRNLRFGTSFFSS